MKNSNLSPLAVCTLLPILGLAARAQSATIVQFPDPAFFSAATRFATDGPDAYVPSEDDDRLWSFSLDTGALLDPDGLDMPAPAEATGAFFFPVARVAVPGFFPGPGVLVADVSDPLNLALAGVVDLPPGADVRNHEVAVGGGGSVGFVASFGDDTLYSFDVLTLARLDPVGLALPGNPKRIALAGDRLAVVDTTNGRILVADVSDPLNLALAGVIALPGAPSFFPKDNVVIAADARTGFVSSNQRVLYSFDVQSLSAVDPDGLVFGTQSVGLGIALRDDVLACLWGRGVAFVDVSDTADLATISDADFGTIVAPQGNATAAFSADGSMAAISVVFPADKVYAFDVRTGARTIGPFGVDDQPNYMVSLGATNRLALVCSGAFVDDVWLIDGMLGPPEIASFCTAKTNSCGALPAMSWTGVPSIAATHGFVLRASGARIGKSGLLLHGPHQAAGQPFQGGTLCIGTAGLRRTPVAHSLGGSPGACDALFELDMNAFASGNGGGNPQPFLSTPGQVVYCQWWGRDTVAHGSLLSDGLHYLVGL